jgi:uncharacterized damage-inducible protein DinB
MTKTALTDAFDHHSWATLKIIDACAALTPDQLASEVPGTYGSILATLRHLVGADVSYLFVLSGRGVKEIDEDALDVAGLRAAMAPNGAAWSALLAKKIDPDEIVVRHRDDGSESHAPRGLRLAQVIHHGSDHRSQICTALTNLGIEPPSIDVWDFAETQGRVTAVPAPA